MGAVPHPEPILRDAVPEDVPQIRALLTECRLPIDGVPEDAALLVVASQAGQVVGVDRDVVDRAHHVFLEDGVEELVLAAEVVVDHGLVRARDLSDPIDPRTGDKVIDERLVPGDGETKFVCPHAGGAKSWLPSSYNPRTKILYVSLVESCMDLTPVAPGGITNGGIELLGGEGTHTIPIWISS